MLENIYCNKKKGQNNLKERAGNSESELNRMSEIVPENRAGLETLGRCWKNVRQGTVLENSVSCLTIICLTC